MLFTCSMRMLATAIVLIPAILLTQDDGARAIAPATTPFYNTWARADAPVANNKVSRTWMWGPEAFTEQLTEDYAEAPGNQRVVQFFDKSRMEITYPDAPQDTPWYVTNGLLVNELVTGRMQVGDNTFETRQPAQVNIAGDPNSGPSYAALADLLDAPAASDGSQIVQRLDSDGNVSTDPSLAAQGVVAAHHVVMGTIDHQVASPFWEFANSLGLVYEQGQYVTENLFDPWFYATGLPITEAYWTTVEVGGAPKLVLLQCFERRCLTYTPQNPTGWKVEAGNVGQHYYQWRYGGTPETERLFIAQLSGEAVAASIDTRATGRAIFCLSDDGESVRVQVWLHDVVEALGVHIHSGEAGPVVYILWSSDGAPFSGSDVLVDDEVSDADLPASTSVAELVEGFTTGQLYIDVHTSAHAGGELRGQVAVADELLSPAELDPRQVPGSPVSSVGSGSAAFLYDRETHSISYRVDIAAVQNPFAAHLHLAAQGNTGPIVVALQTPTEGAPAEGTLTDVDLINDLQGSSIEQLVYEMLRGNIYVNLHTQMYQGGELRGQITSPSIQLTITPAGGVVALPGQITLTIPEDAVDADVIVTITIGPAPEISANQGLLAVASTWTIDVQYADTLAPVQLLKPVSLECSYDESDLPPQAQEDVIHLAYFDETDDAWVTIPTDVYPSQNVAVGAPTHFSRWSLVM